MDVSNCGPPARSCTTYEASSPSLPGRVHALREQDIGVRSGYHLQECLPKAKLYAVALCDAECLRLSQTIKKGKASACTFATEASVETSSGLHWRLRVPSSAHCFWLLKAKRNGGEGGIRTLEGVAPLAV